MATGGYVLIKVLNYLKYGPDVYCEKDARRMPPTAWSAATLDLVTDGLAQLAEWRGLVEQRPLEGLDVPTVHALMNVFHMSLESASTADTPVGRLLDRLVFRSFVFERAYVVVYAVFERIRVGKTER